MKIARTVAELREARARARNVGLVPTMGAFHAGHISLFETARRESGFVVVSLFVNPAQFAPHEDLDRYPRDEAGDMEIARAAGADVVFAPTVDELYPADFATWVDVREDGAEGAARPGHFRGVATICMKLFNIVQPAVAYFGQKDAQQAAVLRQMVSDLNVDVTLRVLPTVRDVDGLALSSRNAYLSEDERTKALALPRALGAGRDAYRAGADPVAATRAALNGLAPEYLEIVELGSAKLLAGAARVGSTRLIDNVILEGELQ
jgi:pantoate--beta-alanine ligase